MPQAGKRSLPRPNVYSPPRGVTGAAQYSYSADLVQEIIREVEQKALEQVTGAVLKITTAYEQGVGHALRSELSNPYTVNTPEHTAWNIGREYGKQQQRNKEQS